MARILGLILFVLPGVLWASNHETLAQAWAHCQAQGPTKSGPGSYGEVTFVDCHDRYPEENAVYERCYAWPGAPLATCHGTGANSPVHSYTIRTQQCEAGQTESGYYRLVSEEQRPGGTMCLDNCEFSIGDDAEEVLDPDCELGATICFYRLKASLTSTGNACGEGDPKMEPDETVCADLGGGWQHCPQDPPRCVRTPDGKLLCPDQPGPDCRLTPEHAACSDRPPPPDYDEPDPPIIIEYCKGGNCGNIQMGSNDGGDDDDDEECEPGDPDCEEEEDEPDCPPNDPDCEDDDDDNAPRAADSGCETETPSCSDMGHVDCQILIRTHRTNCTVAYGNKMLEEFRDRQIEEVRETNAKLKALKETLNVNNASVLDVLQNKIALEVKQTNEKLRDLQATTGKVESAVRGTTAAVDSVGGKLDSQTLELGSKLDQIDGTLQGLDLGDVNIGDISVDNADVVAAIEGGNSLLEGISEKLGDDVVGSIDGPSDSELGLTDDPGDDGGASWIEDVEIDVGELDATGWGWSRSCPSAPTAYVFGRAITFDVGPVCTWLGIGSHLVLLFAALASARIISRA